MGIQYTPPTSNTPPIAPLSQTVFLQKFSPNSSDTQVYNNIRNYLFYLWKDKEKSEEKLEKDLTDFFQKMNPEELEKFIEQNWRNLISH